MHEIPPLAEQMLRAQGVTDAELDQLRRTGTLQRLDDQGRSIDITLASSPGTTAESASITVDGIELSGAALPPAALEKLRRYHRFLPDNVVQNLELATGEDIDGDGQIGGGGSNPAPPPTHGVARVDSAPTDVATRSGAMPPPADPFVREPRGSRLLPAILVLLVLAALAYAAWRALA